MDTLCNSCSSEGKTIWHCLNCLDHELMATELVTGYGCMYYDMLHKMQISILINDKNTYKNITLVGV